MAWQFCDTERMLCFTASAPCFMCPSSQQKDIFNLLPRSAEKAFRRRVHRALIHATDRMRSQQQALIQRVKYPCHPSTSVKIIVPANVPVGLAVVVSVILPALVSQMMSLL